MAFRFGRSPTKVLNGQSIDRSFGPGPSTGSESKILAIENISDGFTYTTTLSDYRIQKKTYA